MSPENEVVIYAIRSVVQHLIQQGVIDEQGFKEHMAESEFKLRKGLGPDTQEASAIIGGVFSVIASNLDD